MLFREANSVYCEDNITSISALCGQNKRDLRSYGRRCIITTMPVKGYITSSFCLLNSECRSAYLPAVNTPWFDRLKLDATCNCERHVITASIYIYVYTYIHIYLLENAVYSVLL